MRSFRVCAVILALASAAGGGELMRVAGEPTAGVIAPRTFNVAMNTFPVNGLRFSVTAGVFPRFMAGLGYGGWNITGSSDPQWFHKVYLKARFRVLDESRSFPAVALGYDNEEEHAASGVSYLRPQRGFYLVLSKNFAGWSGDTGFHCGLSLSEENSDHAGLWLGIDKTLPGGFGAAVDWDMGTNGDPEFRVDNSGGFVSLEAYWESFGQVRVGLRFCDVLETGGDPYRSLAIDFLGLI
ncbi:MAG TPA: hypothetical protein PLM22_04865 [Candidatus Sabulitectum sp.]|nr:hypothetical protein [Candidatus Sabulitectum sp.]HPF31904.1 hypothetical protein [Candidatus Sabulitectum sp.]HPJ28242.1 hypothetical protein [Candidatus Sabulitectum sp.]HPR22728.1 hypothetical protein [Candidatus Sabulitectum sp.]